MQLITRRNKAMKDKIANITRWILYLLLAFVSLTGLLFYTNIFDAETFINIAKVLLIISVAVTVISPIYGFITNPQNIVSMLISVGVAVVVVVVAYTLAGNTLSEYRLEELGTTAETSKLVGMGLITTYIAFGITVLSVLYASVVKMFK
ncbi:MAG: hypothetical protein DRI89_08700 [Bacteroidetes bacterium]|nr:MAG: hypothetical protein DRI89_08700 [Bacteroidota bacterium]